MLRLAIIVKKYKHREDISRVKRMDLKSHQSSILSTRLNMLQSEMVDLRRLVKSFNESIEDRLKLNEETVQFKFELSQ